MSENVICCWNDPKVILKLIGGNLLPFGFSYKKETFSKILGRLGRIMDSASPLLVSCRIGATTRTHINVSNYHFVLDQLLENSSIQCLETFCDYISFLSSDSKTCEVHDASCGKQSIILASCFLKKLKIYHVSISPLHVVPFLAFALFILWNSSAQESSKICLDSAN